MNTIEPARQSSAPTDVNDAWNVARRWRQYEAEIRVNTLRIIAVGSFYLIHLVNQYSAGSSQNWLWFLHLGGNDALSEKLHVAVTAIAVAWMAGALLVHSLLRERVFPRWLPAASTGLDTLLLTAMLLLSSGAASPLVAGYFLIIMMSGLRLNLTLIRAATAGCLAGYLAVLGAARWPRGLLLENALPVVPRYQQLMILAALVLSGVVVGQWARHARRLADDLLRFLQRGAGE
ncbi:MAG: hypothetical protein HY290_17185 [Planctomycetia bacterium]|nr:hypothetical protein [Planctomycetia bacterium]